MDVFGFLSLSTAECHNEDKKTEITTGQMKIRMTQGEICRMASAFRALGMEEMLVSFWTEELVVFGARLCQSK